MIRKPFRKRFTRLLTAALAAGAVLASGNTCPGQDSPAATDFFHEGISARSYGMGGAFVGIADDVSAIYWNPAGLDQLQTSQFYTTRSTKSVVDLDITTQTLSAATPYSSGMFGISLVYSTTGDVLISSSDPVTGRLEATGIDNEDDMAFAASYAFPYGNKDNLSLGATLKYVRQRVFSFSSSGWGLDLGAMYHVDENTRAGITLQNVAGMDIGTDEVPFNVRIGASTKALDDDLLLSASYDSDFLDDQVYGLGAEYTLAENFAARIGSLDGEFTAGLGIAYQHLCLDYSFQNNNDIGDTQKLSIGYNFDTPRKKPRAKAETPERRPAPAAVPEKEKSAPAKKPEVKKESEEKPSRSSRTKSDSSRDKKPEKSAEDIKKEEKPSEVPAAEPVKAIQKHSSISSGPGTVPSSAPEPSKNQNELPPISAIAPPYMDKGYGEVDLSFPVQKDETAGTDYSISYPYTRPPEAPSPTTYDYWPTVPSETGEHLFGMDPN